MPRSYSRNFKLFQTHGRFTIERTMIEVDRRGFTLIDTLDGYCLDFFTRNDAVEAKLFAIEYVKKYGDIDLGCFPFSLDTPLTYCDDRYPDEEGRIYSERPWNISGAIKYKI